MAQMVKAKKLSWAAVVAQLVEQLLPTPEVCSSNLIIFSLKQNKEVLRHVFLIGNRILDILLGPTMLICYLLHNVGNYHPNRIIRITLNKVASS